jgi:hypothetical protein
MPARKNPRLAYCEYVAPDNNSIAVEQARRDLMRCIRRVFPIMLERLATDVLPAYEELAKSDFKIEATLWHPRLSPFKELPQDKSLRTALSRWASEFQAEQDWFLDHMLRTLRGWHVAPDWRSELKCNPIGGVTSTLAMGEPFKFDCEGWEMQLLAWAEYRQSVRERFEQRLADYEEASRNLAESRGLVRAPHKYSPENLEWFVFYQFAGLSAPKIARRIGRREPNEANSSVLKGVKAAAKLIGWKSLRPLPRRADREIR